MGRGKMGKVESAAQVARRRRGLTAVGLAVVSGLSGLLLAGAASACLATGTGLCLSVNDTDCSRLAGITLGANGHPSQGMPAELGSYHSGQVSVAFSCLAVGCLAPSCLAKPGLGVIGMLKADRLAYLCSTHLVIALYAWSGIQGGAAMAGTASAFLYALRDNNFLEGETTMTVESANWGGIALAAGVLTAVLYLLVYVFGLRRCTKRRRSEEAERSERPQELPVFRPVMVHIPPASPSSGSSPSSSESSEKAPHPDGTSSTSSDTTSKSRSGPETNPNTTATKTITGSIPNSAVGPDATSAATRVSKADNTVPNSTVI